MCDKCQADIPEKFRDDKEYAALRTMQLGAIAVACILENTSLLETLQKDINEGMELPEDRFTVKELAWLLDTFLTATAMRAEVFAQQLIARNAARN